MNRESLERLCARARAARTKAVPAGDLGVSVWAAAFCAREAAISARRDHVLSRAIESIYAKLSRVGAAHYDFAYDAVFVRIHHESFPEVSIGMRAEPVFPPLKIERISATVPAELSWATNTVPASDEPE